jgi:hypothetical protein
MLQAIPKLCRLALSCHSQLKPVDTHWQCQQQATCRSRGAR